MADQGGFIRGGAGRPVDGRLVGVITGWLLVASLIALAAVLTVGAVNTDQRDARLRAYGTPVSVTITSCYGRASGTGITVDGYVCRGAFTLNGHGYVAVLGGSAALHVRGDVVPAVADPRSPTTVRLAGSVPASGRRWQPFLTPATLALVAIVLAVAVLWRSRRFRPDNDRRPGPSRTGPPISARSIRSVAGGAGDGWPSSPPGRLHPESARG